MDDASNYVKVGENHKSKWHEFVVVELKEGDCDEKETTMLSDETKLPDTGSNSDELEESGMVEQLTWADLKEKAMAETLSPEEKKHYGKDLIEALIIAQNRQGDLEPLKEVPRETRMDFNKLFSFKFKKITKIKAISGESEKPIQKLYLS